MTMEIVDYPVGKITPYENNPRDNDGAVEAVRASIEEFDWQQPIVVDEDGVIVIGHTRYKAALAMGLETVPVKVAHGLTEEQVRALRLVEASRGEWGSFTAKDCVVPGRGMRFSKCPQEQGEMAWTRGGDKGWMYDSPDAEWFPLMMDEVESAAKEAMK